MKIEVPRMIIQTFAETAVSNGLMHRQTGGILNICLQKEGNMLKAIFEDNGVGITVSKRLNKEKAFRSLKTLNEFIDIFNQLNKTNITYEIKMLNKSDDFPGTQIVVYIPMIEKYRPGKY
jgi:LytS/YehU family sensor histidine kinase